MRVCALFLAVCTVIVLSPAGRRPVVVDMEEA